MSLTMTVSGADRRLKFDWGTAASTWAAGAAPRAQTALKIMAPVSKANSTGPKPGRLRESISERREPSAGAMMVVLYSTMPYAKYVIGGTRPHVIRAQARTRGGWTGPYTGLPGPGSHTLHWIGADGGDVFRMQVHHPGTKPDNFPERALMPLQAMFSELFARAVQEAMDL